MNIQLLDKAAARRESDRIRKSEDRKNADDDKADARKEADRLRKRKMKEKAHELIREQTQDMLDMLGSESSVDEILPPRRKYKTWSGKDLICRPFKLLFLKPLHISYLISHITYH